MTNEPLAKVLAELASNYAEPRPVFHHGEETAPVRCLVAPPEDWSRTDLEESLSITLPNDIVELWNQAGELRLFEEIPDKQWGLVIGSPFDVAVFTEQQIEWYPDDMRPGDLVIGEFIGDAEVLIVRCDPSADDFGQVVVHIEGYDRTHWRKAAESLTEFLLNYRKAEGEKYWDANQSHQPHRP